MKPMTKIVAGLTSAAVLVGGSAIAGAHALTSTDPTPTPPTAPASAAALDQATADALTFMREEERMARDLYTALDEHHGGLAPFTRIKDAEQRHFDALGRLLPRFGLDDPAAGATVGEYADADLQSRYDGWLERGLTSQDEALKVGIELETADIADLEKLIADTDNAQVERILTNLLRGSRHHLDAFTRAADGQLPAGPGAGQREQGQQRQQGHRGQQQGQQGRHGPGMRGPGQRGPHQQPRPNAGISPCPAATG